jgi:hypothetical protein
MVSHSVPGEQAMDDKLLEFLNDKVNSFIKWDLVRFFHDNPHMKDTADNLARYTGRDQRTVKRELDSLVKSKVLIIEEVSHHQVYSMVEDTQVRETIERFMVACHDRNFRVRAIHQVIHSMQFSPRHDF